MGRRLLFQRELGHIFFYYNHPTCCVFTSYALLAQGTPWDNCNLRNWYKLSVVVFVGELTHTTVFSVIKAKVNCDAFFFFFTQAEIRHFPEEVESRRDLTKDSKHVFFAGQRPESRTIEVVLEESDPFAWRMWATVHDWGNEDTVYILRFGGNNWIIV